MAITITEAINEILDIVGESPMPVGTVFDYEDWANEEVGRIYVRLMTVSKEVQSKGWAFNTINNVEISPNVDGELVLPANTLKVDFPSSSSTGTYVQRGAKLFNRDTASFTFEDSLTVPTVVQLLEWDLIPETAQRYILVKAGRIYANRTLGSDSVHGFTALEEREAQVSMERQELLDLDASYF